MNYDPENSPYARSVEEVEAVTQGLLEALGTNKRALKQRSHLPEPTTWTLEAETVEAAFGSIIGRLAFAYAWFAPERRELTAYWDDILKPFLTDDLDSQMLIIQQQLQMPFNESFVLVIDATLAAIEASRAERSGNTNTAWKHVANAMYHLGMLEMTFNVTPMAKELHRMNGKTAAGKKVGNEELVELARTLAERGNYRSRALAASAIEPQVEAEAKRIGYSWRTDTPATAIYRWLAGMRFKK